MKSAEGRMANRAEDFAAALDRLGEAMKATAAAVDELGKAAPLRCTVDPAAGAPKTRKKSGQE